MGESNTPREIRNSPARFTGVTRLGKRSRSDKTGRKEYDAGNPKFAGKCSRSDTIGEEI